MAKITIAGEAVVVTSALKLEDIKLVEKYRPEALKLYDENEPKECIFVVGSTFGNGVINKFGASFGSATHDDRKLATITMGLGEPVGDVREHVAESVGVAILLLNKVEEKIPAVLADIEAEKAAVLENIAVAE